MYKVTSSQVGFRVNELEKSAINESMAVLQKENETTFGSVKDYVLQLITKCNRLESDLLTLKTVPIETIEKVETVDFDTKPNRFQVDFTDNIEVQKQLQKIIENESLPIESDTETVVCIALTKALTELEPQTIEVEKLVTAELPEHSVLLQISEKQNIILQTVAERRFENREDKELQTVEQTATSLIFNKCTLFNWGGGFPTGLNLSDFKK